MGTFHSYAPAKEQTEPVPNARWLAAYRADLIAHGFSEKEAWDILWRHICDGSGDLVISTEAFAGIKAAIDGSADA